MRQTLVRLASFAALTLAAVGCSSGETPDSSALFAHETDTRSIDSETFATLVGMANLNGAGFWVRDGHGGLMPSPEIAGAMYPGEQPPKPENHVEAFEVPQIDYDPGIFAPTLHATMTRLDKRAVGVWMGADAIVAQVVLDGAVHVHTAWPWPDGDVILDQVTINVSVAVHGGQLSTAEVTANVQDHVENCGAFGWCSDLVTAVLPDLSNDVANAIRGKLDELLPKPETSLATVTFLETLTNIGVDGPRWQVAPASVNLANWQVTFDVTRDTP